jgi:hypothetical protein
MGKFVFKNIKLNLKKRAVDLKEIICYKLINAK